METASYTSLTSNQTKVRQKRQLRNQKPYMVPQFNHGGSSGVPAVPATILMSV